MWLAVKTPWRTAFIENNKKKHGNNTWRRKKRRWSKQQPPSSLTPFNKIIIVLLWASSFFKYGFSKASCRLWCLPPRKPAGDDFSTIFAQDEFAPRGLLYIPSTGTEKRNGLCEAASHSRFIRSGWTDLMESVWRAWLIVNAGSIEWSHRRWQLVISALVVISAVAAFVFCLKAQTKDGCERGSPEDVCYVCGLHGTINEQCTQQQDLIWMGARKTNFFLWLIFFFSKSIANWRAIDKIFF